MSSSTPKTPARTNETQDPVHQVKFLLSVWRNCEGGRINWDPILTEFSIPTQGAAAKRLERLLKTHDMKVSAVVKNLPNAQLNGASTNGDASTAVKRPASDSSRTPLPSSAKKPRTAGSAKGKGKGKAVVAEEPQEEPKEGQEDEGIPIKEEPSDEGNISEGV